MTKLIENQHFSGKWRFLYIPIVLLLIYLYPVQAFLNQAFDLKSLIPVLSFSPVILVLEFSVLRTEFDKDAIVYRFFPFEWRKIRLGRDQIDYIEIREFNPISDFGGWGLRYDHRKDRVAYFLSGKSGIVITKTNGKKLILGTGKSAEELRNFLQEAGYELRLNT